MTLRTRLFILAVFFLVFFITAPLMIFYTAGFRYNWQKGKVENVGVLILDVQPPTSHLYLNNTLLDNARPLRLTDLLPNFYSIRAEKDGYFPWQKNLEVRGRESTLVYDIALFKKQTPQWLETGSLTGFSLSPDNNILIFQKLNTIWSYNLQNKESKMLHLLPYQIDSPEYLWSPSNGWLIIRSQTSDNFAMASAQKKDALFAWQVFDAGPLTNPQWGDNDGYIYGLAKTQNNSLYQINFIENTKKLIAKEVISFAITGDEIYLTKTNKGITKIYRYRQNTLSNQKLEEIAVLPLGHYEIFPAKNDFLPLADGQGKLYVVNLASKSEPLWQLKGNRAVWGRGEKNNYLYYFNNEELWIFDPRTKISEMLTRYSAGLQETMPVPKIPYVSYLVGSNLMLTELDDRDARNTYALFEGKGLSYVQMDKNGKKIYFLQEKGNGYKELLMLEIQ